MYCTVVCAIFITLHCLCVCCEPPPPSPSVLLCAVCEAYNHNLVFDGADMKMGFTAREAINKGKPCDCHVTTCDCPVTTM